ncbi:MAG: ABC transporter ATP-binding protein [Cellulosilyticum sp.]|nr:ABC transporter ATP-binding protein [Cellulosilyticum sp.]
MRQPVIQFTNFSYQYRVQSEPTLKNINLTIYEGEKVLIVGPSGSGKSTLAHTLNGLIPFNTEGKISGSLKINGKETKSLSIFEISQMVGTVLQDPDGQFIGLTVAEDIAFSLENRCVSQAEMHKRVWDTSKLVEIHEHLNMAPQALSGGQKQRTSLGGVMVDDVDILLFDEPLASLDPATGQLAIELIDQLNQETKKTIIIVEHRLEDVLHAPIDRIIVMNKGEILADCTPNELLQTSLLTETGIREPLYITALKYAGCELKELNHLDVLDELDVTPYKEKLEAFLVNSSTLKESSEAEVLLEFDHLCFSYDQTRPLLQDINFKVRKGDMLSIVGRNGTGKSTLSKLICGFYKPTNGRILLHGKDTLKLSIKERSNAIGMVMQNPNQMLSKPMIYDEVALALRLKGLPEDEVKQRVYETLKVCGLYPMRNWPISALSYGQKKRVSIAAILVANPEILILDEPTAGQDFKHYTELMEFLKSLNEQGITIIMITHDMHLMLEYTSRSIVVAHGKLLADSTPVKVLSNPYLVEQASLKETSLYTLAMKANLKSAEALTESFIHHDRRRRESCQPC